METTLLNLSLSNNLALNTDQITALRFFNVTAGNVYQTNLNFLNGSVPTISEFVFDIRNSVGVNVVSVTGLNSQTGQYPYYFTLDLTAPNLQVVGDYSKYNGFLSFVSQNGITTISPFGVQVQAATSGTPSVSYVASINGLSSQVFITGGGNVSISSDGQTLSIFGDTSTLATIASLNATGNALGSSISALQAETGSFYLASNPSGYVGSSALSAYALNSSLQATGSSLLAQVLILDSQTGSFALSFALAATGSALQGEISTLAAQTGSFASASALAASGSALQGEISSLQSVSGSFALATSLGLTGFSLQSEISSIQNVTGSFYLASNPSSYITASSLAPYAPISTLNSSGSFLQGEILLLQGVTGSFYLSSNPAAYITLSALAPYATITNLAATGNSLQSEVASITGVTGSFYLSSNPSAYITASALAPYATVVNLASTGNSLQATVNSLTSLTGSFALASNLAVTGATLQTEITALQASSGTYVNLTGAQNVSGVKTFLNQIVVTGIANTGGSNINLSANLINDRGNNSSIDWQNRTLNTSGGASSLAWQTLNLFDLNDNASLDWKNRKLYDTAGALSANWSGRTLADSSQLTSVDYGNRVLSGNWLCNGSGTSGTSLVNFGTLSGVSGALQSQISNPVLGINLITGSTYTLQQSDSFNIVEYSGAATCAITLPSGLAKGFNTVLVQAFTGIIQLTGITTGVNLFSFGNYTKSAGQWSQLSLYVRQNTGNAAVWVAGGIGQ